MEISVKDGKNIELLIKVNYVQSKFLDIKCVDDINLGNFKNVDLKKESLKISFKFKGSGDVNFKLKRLELEEKNMEVIVVIKVKLLEQRQQDKFEFIVLFIIIRVRKSIEFNDVFKVIFEVLVVNIEEFYLFMILRGKGIFKSFEDFVYNLRYFKVQKQVLE